VISQRQDVIRVLLIEDNPIDAIVVTRLLQAASTPEHLEVALAGSVKEALQQYDTQPPDVVLTDLSLPDADGLAALDSLLTHDPEAVIVVLTGDSDEAHGEAAVRRGAQDYVVKGSVTGAGLRRVIRYARGRRAARLESDEYLREEKAFAESVIDAMPGMFAMVDAEGLCHRWNRGLAEFIGGTGQPNGIRLIESVISEEQDRVIEARRHAIETGHTRLEINMVRYDGKVVPFLVTAVRIFRAGDPYLLLAGMDLSERRSMEAQLIHAQKLESLGRLAGGVAHDFNNMLAAVLSFAELLLMDSAPDDPRRGDVETIREAAMRATGLTRQLLAFSRRQVFTPRVIELNAIISGLDRLLRRLIGEDIELVTVMGEGVGFVEVDPGQLEAALVNLAVNARDAMPDGGTLTIETSVVNPEDGPKAWTRVVVSDTGTGMTEDVQRHLFEPFFTTKEAGKGTGLGLATVYGIIKQSGGAINVKTEVGNGTAFFIDIPRVAGAEAAGAKAAGAAVPGGTETIIVAEDNDLVRHGITATMTARGYTILQAVTGEEALRIARSHQGKIDLVLSDVVMPKMAAPEMLRQMKEILPDTRVLLMSGYVSDAVQKDLGTMAFIQKPFTSVDLARKVREVLDAGRNPA
jgi:PAS domain S-box-containing protein